MRESASQKVNNPTTNNLIFIKNANSPYSQPQLDPTVAMFRIRNKANSITRPQTSGGNGPNKRSNISTMANGKKRQTEVLKYNTGFRETKDRCSRFNLNDEEQLVYHRFA